MNLKIQYFASLREQAGCSEETLELDGSTPKEVYEALQEKYGFKLSSSQLRAAVNSEYVQMMHPLKPDDVLTFIPPVAGG